MSLEGCNASQLALEDMGHSFGHLWRSLTTTDFFFLASLGLWSDPCCSQAGSRMLPLPALPFGQIHKAYSGTGAVGPAQGLLWWYCLVMQPEAPHAAVVQRLDSSGAICKQLLCKALVQNLPLCYNVIVPIFSTLIHLYAA